MSLSATSIMIGEGSQWNWKVYQLTFERWVDLYSMKKQVMDIQGSQNSNKNIFKWIKICHIRLCCYGIDVKRLVVRNYRWPWPELVIIPTSFPKSREKNHVDTTFSLLASSFPNLLKPASACSGETNKQQTALVFVVMIFSNRKTWT